MCVAARDNQGQGGLTVGCHNTVVILTLSTAKRKDLLFGTAVRGSLLPLFQQHRMNMPFKMVDGNERKAARKRERLGVSDADQQRACQARTRSDGDGVQFGESDVGLSQSGANRGNNRAQVFAAG